MCVSEADTLERTAVAVYQVLVRGTEIDVPGAGGGRAIVGFHATRAVRAPTADQAAQWALALVASEWTREPHQRSNRKGPPVLRVEKVGRIGLFRYLTHPNRGFTFCTDEQ
jgi:hypothetical protein